MCSCMEESLFLWRALWMNLSCISPPSSPQQLSAGYSSIGHPFSKGLVIYRQLGFVHCMMDAVIAELIREA